MKQNKMSPWRLPAALLSTTCCAALCLPLASRAANYTSVDATGAGDSWAGAHWQLNGTGTKVGPPTAGNTYELISNGNTITAGTDSRTRDPATNGSTQVFPGDSLQLDLNTDLRLKGPGTTVVFPGPGGGLPGLILNGGLINIGDDGEFFISGIISVNQQSYLNPATTGSTADLRSMSIKGQLIGSGNLVVINAGMAYPQEIAGNNNTFAGQWILKDGWLLGSGNGSLGTNSITVDPNWTIPSTLGAFVSSYTKALLDIGYDINSAGTLTLANGGQFSLHQNCCFAGAVINGTTLTNGTYYYSNLVTQFPANFPTGGKGSITIQPYGTPPIVTPPAGNVETWISADVGGPTYVGSVITNANGTLDILGGGSDIWGGSSQFHYYYAWASGQQWDVSAQIVGFSGPDTWSKVELMVSQSNPTTGPQGGDAFIANMITQPSWVIPPDGTAGGQNVAGVDQFRTTANGGADWLQVGTNPRPDFPDQWVRINRNGSIFTVYNSADGGAWTPYLVIDTSKTTVVGSGSTTFGTAWTNNIMAVGIAVTAHNNGWTTTNGIAAGADATIANLQATFPSATAPTFVTPSQQIQTSVTNSYGCEASLSFVATNNAFPLPNLVGINYQWYKNGTAIAGATSTVHTWLLDNSDSGAHYYCAATLAAPFTAITTNSLTATVGVLPGVYYTNGLKVEMLTGAASLGATEQGNVNPASWQALLPNLDQPGNFGNYYATRVSGWFIAPTTDTYTFYDASDDQSDLFLSTDATMSHKVWICQETGWNNLDQWLTGGTGGGNNYAQQCSTTFVNPTTSVAPYPTGIPLTAGQPYYIEQDHYQGTGGDCFAVTYQTATMLSDPNWINEFTNGTPSLLYATNGTLMFVTKPVTTLTWVTQPTNTTATLGLPVTFYAQGTSDSELTLKYQWYRGLTAIPGATTSSYGLVSPASTDSGAQFYVVATTAENELSITSHVATLNVAAPVLERGVAKMEYWYSPNPGMTPFFKSVTNTALNTITNYLLSSYATPANYTIYEPLFEGNSKYNMTPNFTTRLTAYFYPPATGLYDFYVNSDDAGALFVSTDNTPGNAVMVAQETGWDNSWQWTATSATKCSATFQDANGNLPFANGIQMNAGQPYFVALIHQDTGGGNNCEATFISHGATAPALGSYSAMTGNVIATYVPRSFTVAFTQQPGTVSVPLGGLVTLTAQGITDSTSALGDEGNAQTEYTNSAYYVQYQWTKNGAPIPGATSTSYSFGPVSPLDSAQQFACQIRSLGYVNNSLVDIWSNSTPANIVMSGTAVYEPGFVLHEYFSLNPPIASIAGNTAGTPSWLMATPAFEVDVTAVDIANNFSDELVGFFIPPVSGNYVFFLNSDDGGQLFMSPNSSSAGKVMIAQETGAAGPLAWGTGGTAAQVRSDTFVDPTTGLTPFANGIPLAAGQKYFMQAVHAQGGGGTETCVNAILLGDPTPATGSLSTMRGAQVGTYVPACTYVTVTNQPQSVTVTNYGSATFAAGGATDSQVPVGTEYNWSTSFNNFLAFQWYKSGQPVAGATASTFTYSPVMPNDAGSPVYCTMRALGYADIHGNALWTTSSVAYINVITSAPPTLLYAGVYTNYADANFIASLYQPVIYVDLAFSGRMDPVALLNPANYVFAPQPGCGITSANITGITVNSNGYRQVELALNASPNLPFGVTVNGVRALGGGPVLAGTNGIAVKATLLTCFDVGNLATPDPVVPTTLYVDGTNAYTVQSEGSDIWNNADGFNFLYELKDGNFDVVVRQVDTTHVSNWTKGGLMIRESLDMSSRNWNIVNDPVTSDNIEAVDNTGYGANMVECNGRTTTGGASASWATNTAPVPAYPNAWVRLTYKRIISPDGTVTNDIITAYSGTNGSSWTLLGQTDAATNGTEGPLVSPLYVGICTTAHDNDSNANVSAGTLLYVDTADYANYNSSYISTQPTLKIVNAGGGNVSVSWTPSGGTLMSSPALLPPAEDWQPASTTNPAIIPITSAPQFFRVNVN